MTRSSSRTLRFGISSLAVLSAVACAGQQTGAMATHSEQRASAAAMSPGLPAGPATQAQVLRGRQVVLTRACGACHGGGSDPTATGWLAGMTSPEDEFQIGPFKTRPRNLTPDNTTGLGRFSERQIFNSLRYGLRPGETPDVEITSTIPGQGNFPANPKFLAPPMPWPWFRHMPDGELWAVAAYLKHGLAPVNNRVPDSEGPPDFWASEYTPEKIGTYPAPPFPTSTERVPGDGGRSP